MTTTTTAIEQQSLRQDFTRCLIQGNSEVLFKFLNDIELDLESILSQEFEQGLPNDLDNGY